MCNVEIMDAAVVVKDSDVECAMVQLVCGVPK
jgi:hypothetical protein